MLRPDFVCVCGELAEPSENGVDPPIQYCNGRLEYVGACCNPECDAESIIVPVEGERLLGGPE